MEYECVRRKGGRSPRCRLPKPRDAVHGSPDSPPPGWPVGTGETLYTRCDLKHVTVAVSVLAAMLVYNQNFLWKRASFLNVRHVKMYV